MTESETKAAAFEQFYVESLRESAETAMQTIDQCRDNVRRAIDLVLETYRLDGKVMFCGNGGSAADCQHLATELMIRLSHDLDRPALGAISLCTDPSAMTAGGNDIGFENVFARSIEGLGRSGDTLIVISTSGRSSNIVRSLEVARSRGIGTIGLLGCGGGSAAELCDVAITVPSDNVQRIQETHITLGHIICETVERELFAGE